MLLDKEFKADCSRLGITIRTPPASRFETLIQGRHVQVGKFIHYEITINFFYYILDPWPFN
jgi:hypothetical protein